MALSALRPMQQKVEILDQNWIQASSSDKNNKAIFSITPCILDTLREEIVCGMKFVRMNDTKIA